MSDDHLYPRFSDSEMARRRAALEGLAAEHGLDALVLYGADRSGTAVAWITGWPVTTEAAVLLRPGQRDLMLVQLYNHVPNARRLAERAEVHWGGDSTVATLCDVMRAAGMGGIGVVGPLRRTGYRMIADAAPRVVSLDDAYLRLRMVKSSEEIAWMRRGAELSDRAVERLRAEAEIGMDEYRLAAIIESAYLAEGGVNQIHYLAATPMDAPDVCVPAQWPSTRRLRAGDVVVTEISASWWGYPGQVLRTMTVGAEPTPLFAELHRVADAAYQAVLARLRHGATAEEVVEAASLIEEAGFTIYDDLLHGYGGGYLPPVLRTRGSGGAVPDVAFQAGMTVVIQPNVITRDEKAGVQTGGLVLVTEEGATPLQRADPGLWVIG